MFDQLHDIAKISCTMHGGHPGSELELYESCDGEQRHSFASDCRGGGIWEPHRLGFPIPGVIARDQEVDRDTELGVANALAARELLHIASTEVLRLEPF